MGHNVIRLRVIQEAAANTREILIIQLPEITFFSDDGVTDFICGRCKAVLANSITEGQLGNLILKCNKCQSLNELPTTKPDEKD